MDRKLSRFFGIFSWVKSGSAKLVSGIRAVPVVSLLVGLLIFVSLWYVAEINSPKVRAESDQPVTKKVSVYRLGGITPVITVNGVVHKKGILQVKALMGGVVQQVNVQGGDSVKKHTNLVQLSNTYDGGNSASIQASIAKKQYENLKQSYDLQRDLISKQREVAELTDISADRLREVNNQSLEDTRNLLEFNEGLLDDINDRLEDLEATASSPMIEELLFTTRQAKAQLQAGINQMRSGVRQLEMQDEDDDASSKLSNLQKEITLKQLDLQEQSLTLGLEVSKLQTQLTTVQSQLMHPTAFSAGVIERVFISEGDVVNPGQTLLSLRTDDVQSEIVLETTGQIARQISGLKPSRVWIDGEKIDMVPEYVSSTATNGQLYSVLFLLPEEFSDQVENGEFVQIDLSLSQTGDNWYVPIDALFQTQQANYVLIVEGDKAVQRVVEWDTVVGELVLINEGLDEGALVVMDRTVVAGDAVEISNSN